MFTVGLLMSGCEGDNGTAFRGDLSQLIGQWRLRSFGVIGQETGVLAGRQIMIEFLQNGSMGGNGGCNSYGASYRANRDGSLEFDPIVFAMMACLDPGAQEQEGRYLRALASVERFEIAGGQLRLFYNNRTEDLIYEK